MRFGLGHKVAIDVSHLTQTKDESDEEYTIRFLTFGGWRVLLAKIVERTDNIWTLDKDDIERSRRKIHDTVTWFVKIQKRLEELIQGEVEAGRLSQDWITVVSFLIGYLWYAVREKKREFDVP